MKQYPLAIYCNHDEPQFELGTAAELARVSEDFIYRCDREGLVTSRVIFMRIWGLIWRLWIWWCDIGTRSERCNVVLMSWNSGCAKRIRNTILRSWRFAGSRHRYGMTIRRYLKKVFGPKIFYEITQRKWEWWI
jgi:hypothetical protein